MPPVQQHLPTETEKGAGTPASRFSIRHVFKSLVGAGKSLFALESAIMTKPGNVGAPAPINTLSNNTGTSSRSAFGISSASRSIPSSPPPAKRQKLNESSTSPSHTHAFFAKAETPTPRRLSTGSVSVADSQQSVVSNRSPSQRTIDKHRAYATRRASRRDRSLYGHSRLEEDPTDDEVDLISPGKAKAGLEQPKRRRPEERSILEFSDRFKVSTPSARSDGLQRFQNAIEKAEKRESHKRPDSSPDELAPNSEEIEAGRPTKRQRRFSASLLRRPKIESTTSRDTFSPIWAISMERLVDLKGDANTIIPHGLRILRGASGQCQYQAVYEGDPDYCSLAIREIGHTLSPVDQNNNILKSYAYLRVDLKHVKTILRSKDGDSCRIVNVMFSTMDLSNSAGPKLFVEFATVEELARFFQWVALYKNEGCSVSIKDCSRAKLERDLDEMMQRARSHKIITDDEARFPVAEDLKVIQHNQSSRVPTVQTDHYVSNEYRAQPRLRDAMKPPDSINGVASRRSWDDQPAPTQRQPRTTRSMFAYEGSPEPREPRPKGWTSLNAGWEKQWRNSLVYPNAGKNRATIDKDDIQRLDEGQFLNDNIIIFYLRYLQKNLEDNNGDVAKRIYFQNTFFYDKLKPTKTGQGINYDSVKSWTSKVDLFSKDYIIVPINEYTHWYVAIICNAPKLLPSSVNHGTASSEQSDITAVPNDTSSWDLSRTTSQIEKSDNNPNCERVVPIQEDVVENLRGMSISSSGHSNKAKQKADNDAGEASDSIPTKDSYEVYEIKDSDKLEAEVEHIATTAHPPTRKKMGKRQGIGPRKYDPNQPRIITLDSLGAPHSPTCSYLRQYLVAELRDKKGIVIPSPGAMGTTAKDVPEQTNHCDCGLFLLGYIQEFLHNPDLFIRSLLQRDGEIPWRLEPSELRADIRNLIFDLQKKQQEAEDLAKERKRQAKSSHYSPSKLEPANQAIRNDKASENKSPEALTNSLQSSTRGRSNTPGEADHGHFPICGIDAESAGMKGRSQPQLSTHIFQGDDSRTRQSEIGNALGVQEKAAGVSDLHVVASPRTVESVINDESHNLAANTTSPPLAKDEAAEHHCLSPETEASTYFQRDFVPPLVSETPSSKGSRGATPLDPVIVDDSDQNEGNRSLKSPQRHRGGQTGHRLIVEIPSTNVHRRSLGQDDKKDSRAQAGEQSSYFANRRNGERLTAASLREKPVNDVIDLSDD
ncbi:hypothetical protein GGR51DRAFT_568 [Nemania sp. FL0031]|nr:hypothetical protein GGR51DRAFT_568 [Nemania sp. FL0031]